MNLQLFVQSVSVGMAGMAVWFIYELIKEFKAFKKEASRDIQSLNQEREHFENTAKSACLDISHRVADLSHLHNDFALEIQKVLKEVTFDVDRMRNSVEKIVRRIDSNEAMIKKAVDVTRTFNDRMKYAEEELGTLKVILDKDDIIQN
jgi:hypothetical protein